MADTQTSHPHLSDVLAPVRSEDDFELSVIGRIPDAAWEPDKGAFIGVAKRTLAWDRSAGSRSSPSAFSTR